MATPAADTACLPMSLCLSPPSRPGTLVTMPATALTCSGCARSPSTRTENTRPRFDCCSARRVRPQRSHRPRLVTPGLRFPLRQLALDPSVPVEGGSANDYDYAAGGPVNNLDLDGTEVRGYFVSGTAYGLVGGGVTVCDLADDRRGRTQTISVSGGMGVEASVSGQYYLSNAPTVNDVLGWPECQYVPVGFRAGQLCFLHGQDGNSYYSSSVGVGTRSPLGGKISAVRTYKPNALVRQAIRGITPSPPKCDARSFGDGRTCAFRPF
jgi:hypothetical protein